MLRLLLALCVLLALSACAGSESPPTNSPTTTPDRFGAPVVQAPRDVTRFAAEPCRSLLSARELQELGLPSAGRQRAVADVQECTWQAADREELSLYIATGRDLLAATYRNSRGGVVEPILIEDMPAVVQKTGPGDINICTITTGLGPTEALEATWVGTSDIRPGNDACDLAQRAATLVVQKLPPAR